MPGLATISVRDHPFRPGRHPGGCRVAGVPRVLAGSGQVHPSPIVLRSRSVCPMTPDPPAPTCVNRRDFQHAPVLLDRVVELFRDVPTGLYVDATLGGGGHAAAVLDANPGLRLLGLDRDDVAIEAARRTWRHSGPRRARPHRLRPAGTPRERTNHRRSECRAVGSGVSSPQLDVAERGFSYRPGPLDMRMDRARARPPLDVVTSTPCRARLRHPTVRRGRFASRIARAIVDARPLRTPSSWPTSCATRSRPRLVAPVVTPRSGPSRPSASRSTASSTSWPRPSTERSPCSRPVGDSP